MGNLSKSNSSEDNYRDVFDDRVCDDLCQFILQYLSVKDKLRLECVSKQFQRTILQNQTKLCINLSTDRLENFEHLLKRFPNIKEIQFSKELIQFEQRIVYNKAIELIIKNSIHLTHFNGFSSFMSKDNRQEFIKKFGSNLISIELFDGYISEVYQYFNKVLNLKKLMVKIFEFQLNSISFTRLKSFEVMFLKVPELDLFEVFAVRNGQHIKYLTLGCRHIRDLKDVKRVLNIISKFPKLVDLKFRNDFIYDLRDETIATHLKQIAVKCNQIKSLDFSILIELEDSITNGRVFSPLEQFKRLKRLGSLYFYSQHEVVPKKSILWSDFQELTHLRICIPRLNSTSEETIFQEMNSYLPNLRSLEISVIDPPFETIVVEKNK